jgi:hypothetical protein
MFGGSSTRIQPIYVVNPLNLRRGVVPPGPLAFEEGEVAR